LKNLCKRYKRNKKTKKDKSSEQKVYKRALGNPSGPALESARGPLNHFPNRYPLFLSPSLTCGPHMSSSSSSRKTRQRLSPSRRYSSFTPLYSPLISAPLCAYITPKTPSAFPLSSRNLRRRQAVDISRRRSTYLLR
jgi:hypothetical protein